MRPRPADRDDIGAFLSAMLGAALGCLAWLAVTPERTTPLDGLSGDFDRVPWDLEIGLLIALFAGGALAATLYSRLVERRWPWPFGPRRGGAYVALRWRLVAGFVPLFLLQLTRQGWPGRTVDPVDASTLVLHDMPSVMALRYLSLIGLAACLWGLGMVRSRHD